MGMRRRQIVLTSLTALFAALTLETDVKAADGIKCIPLMTIDETPIIDDKTILVKLKTGGRYKRIDLFGSCPGMQFSGYAHSTRTNELCSTDTLAVLQPVGAMCTIKDIVDISEPEAKALLGRKR
jgi:hypothetical protein